jgi:hypothetical protein
MLPTSVRLQIYLNGRRREEMEGREARSEGMKKRERRGEVGRLMI